MSPPIGRVSHRTRRPRRDPRVSRRTQAARDARATRTRHRQGPAPIRCLGDQHPARSEPAGIASELVYVTDVEGFELNTQTVGVMSDDGMSAMYVRYDGDAVATVMLTTARDAGADDVLCAELPDSSEPEPVLRCVVERGDASIALDGEGVAAATLRAAAEAVRVPTSDELDHLFAEVPVPEAPVERGDLPPEGDGAPLNDVGAGG